MALRDAYKHMLGIPYSSGKDDCYGLARRYYKEVYDVDIVDAARPDGWWNEEDMDLINQFITHDGWQNLGTNTRNLKLGDGLVFSLINGKANHVGCYVGNGMFIHHIYGRFSTEDALTDKWTSRLLMIIRHPKIHKAAESQKPKTDLMNLLPEHIRARLIRPT
jgi:cell wall-associated NlpC family hydrolase